MVRIARFFVGLLLLCLGITFCLAGISMLNAAIRELAIVGISRDPTLNMVFVGLGLMALLACSVFLAGGVIACSPRLWKKFWEM